MATSVNVIGKRKRSSSANHEHWNFPIADLPKDILINILCCLPTKSIVGCKQVCKEWHNIILNPRFAEAHYNYMTATTIMTSRLSLVGYPYRFNSDDSIYLIEGYNNNHQYDDYKLVSSKLIHNVPSLITQNGVTVVNSCRGFLFISNLVINLPEVGCDFHVYNPLTKQHFKLPPVTVTNLSDIQPTMLGLGFGPVTKQYKAVRLVVDKDKGVYDLGVHTLGTDHQHVWRRVETSKISSDLHDKVFLTGGQPLALNGILHWPMNIFIKHKYDDQVTKEAQKIACFDVDKEELSTIATPRSNDSSKIIVDIGNVNGMLCLGMIKSGDETEFWVMREYGVKESWAIYVVLKNDIVGCPPSLVKVCSANGEIVFLCGDENQHFYLFSYNQKEGRSTRLRISGFDETIQAEATTYVPSFFSISSRQLSKLN